MASEEKRIKRSITTHQKSSSAGSKKVFDPELESFTKRVRRFDNTLHRNGLNHEKLTIETLSQYIMIALDKFYPEDQSGFYTSVRQFLEKGIESWKQNIVDRMDTYEYLQMAIAHKPFTDIESHIIKQWRKNHLLFAIMTFWYSSVQKSHFISLKQFKKQYDKCRQIVSQLSNVIFKPWLTNWEKRMEKNNVNALVKLFDETSHFIITESSQFKRVYQKVMIPLIDLQFIGTTLNWQYNLEQLQTKKCVFDLQRQENLPKTIQVLKKFGKQMKLSKKLQLLRQYRLTLQQEINTQQQEIQRRQGHKNGEILAAEDYVSAYVYCIIKGRLSQIRYCLLYMSTLLGEQLSILSKMKIKVYYDGLLAANEFLTINRLTEQQQRQMEMLQNLAMNRRVKVISSPLIEGNDFAQVMAEYRQLQSVRNLTQIQHKSTSLEMLSPHIIMESQSIKNEQLNQENYKLNIQLNNELTNELNSELNNQLINVASE